MSKSFAPPRPRATPRAGGPAPHTVLLALVTARRPPPVVPAEPPPAAPEPRPEPPAPPAAPLVVPAPAPALRVHSHRLVLLVALLYTMVFATTIVSVGLIAFAAVRSTPDHRDHREAPPRLPVISLPPRLPVDTGVAAVPPVEVAHVEPAPVEPAPPPPVKTPKTGTVTVTLADGAPRFTAISITCEDFRQRASFSGLTASMPDVPRTECKLYFKGGGAMPNVRVTGGQSLTCTFLGTMPSCE